MHTITLTDAELRALCRGLDHYLPQLSYEVARIDHGAHDMAELERTLVAVRARFAAELDATRPPAEVP